MTARTPQTAAGRPAGTHAEQALVARVSAAPAPAGEAFSLATEGRHAVAFGQGTVLLPQRLQLPAQLPALGGGPRYNQAPQTAEARARDSHSTLRGAVPT